MKITAIIAEYNPFHNGHLKQLKKAKKDTGADILAVVMSGSFTQHGDICVEDKFVRAKWAIDAGADIVLELPTVYSLSSATNFAEGALKTLSLLSNEFTLSFGTEEEELEELRLATEFMASESKDVSNSIKGFLSEGYSLAKSRSMAINLVRPDIANMIQSPNNILAIEYMKAGAKYPGIQYYSINRKEDDGKKFLCSTKIREKIINGENYSSFIPEFVQIEKPTDLKKYSIASSFTIKNLSKDQLVDIANITEGFENKINKTDFNSLEEFMELTSKRHTKSLLKRIAACVTIGVTKELVDLAKNEKPYTTVLAIKNSKKKILLPILSQADGYFYFKASDCPEDSPVKKLIDLDTKAYKVQKFCQNQ